MRPSIGIRPMALCAVRRKQRLASNLSLDLLRQRIPPCMIFIRNPAQPLPVKLP
jgi:hypothetical protein